MKIEPPIRISLPEGDGHIIEMDRDGAEVTVKLLSGEIIKIDGQRPANLYEDRKRRRNA